ncbi:unnamed protein product [Caenorhabditis nigoni]
MTSVDEDLLLNDPVATEFDHSATIDEDLLLGAGDIITRKETHDSIDDAALLLDSVEPASEQDPERAPENNDGEQNDVLVEEDDDDDVAAAVESDKEELDYDEEEEDEDQKRERTSRYTSERNGGNRVNSEDSDEQKKENKEKSKKPAIPSLFDKTITNNPLKSGDQPIGVVLRIEGEPERIFYPPPSFMANMVQQPIVPRLPNGIPLVGVPANHGRAGFGTGYQQQGRMAGGGGMAGASSNPGQWENDVVQFLNQSSTRGRASKKRRSSSYSSASSYSSGSRSRSRSSSRDRRRDEKRRRRDHREVSRRDYGRRDDRRDDRRRHDDRRTKDRDSYRDTRDSRDSERESRRRKEQSRASTMESARALGLSSDYINQMNEQKRKREEIVRKKEERRHGPSSDKKENSSAAPPPSAPKEKPKAYLAVNVSGVQQLPTAVKKIEAVAVEMGPIKKCWRSADDVVSIIFNAHDKAKDFMIKYNGKVLSGLRITVSLEKKFLNLNEVN